MIVNSGDMLIVAVGFWISFHLSKRAIMFQTFQLLVRQIFAQELAQVFHGIMKILRRKT